MAVDYIILCVIGVHKGSINHRHLSIKCLTSFLQYGV